VEKENKMSDKITVVCEVCGNELGEYLTTLNGVVSAPPCESCLYDEKDRGYYTGREEGKESGIEEGQREGFIEGRTVGYHSGYDEGFDDGFDKGCEKGRREG